MLRFMTGPNRRERRHARAKVTGVGWLGGNSKTSGRRGDPS